MNLGIGDHIFAKALLDAHKSEFGQIYLSYNSDWAKMGVSPKRKYFVMDMMNLFFNEPPYIITEDQSYPKRTVHTFMLQDHLMPVFPHLEQYLCRGEAPQIDREFIILTTKVRSNDGGSFSMRNVFNKISSSFLSIMNELSKKYQIILMGEKTWNIDNLRHSFSLYKEFVQGIKNRDDRTLPFGTINDMSLSRIQQDCTLMNKAKAIIVFGHGGNFCMAAAVGNVLCLKNDGGKIKPVENYLYGETYDKEGKFITQDYKKFIGKLDSLRG